MIEDPLDKRLVFLAWYVITAIFAYIGAVTFLPVPETGSKYADMAVPFLLGSGFGALVGFYFAGSPNKKNGIVAPITSQTAAFHSTETIDKTTEVMKPPVERTVEEKKPEVKP